MYFMTNPLETSKVNLLSSIVCQYWSAVEVLLAAERYYSLCLEAVWSEKKRIQHGFKRVRKSNELI